MHLFRWNLRICFGCIWNLGCSGIFLEYLLQFWYIHRERILLLTCFFISKMPQTLAEIQWNPSGKAWEVSVKLQSLVYFHAPLFTFIMFILPLMTGHLFWKATILGGLYRGVPLYMYTEHGYCFMCRCMATRENISGFYYTPRFNEVERGVYWYHLVRLSVCPRRWHRLICLVLFRHESKLFKEIQKLMIMVQFLQYFCLKCENSE